jgi:copper chaperone CopZ
MDCACAIHEAVKRASGPIVVGIALSRRLFFATVQASACMLVALVESLCLFAGYPELVKQMIVEPG